MSKIALNCQVKPIAEAHRHIVLAVDGSGGRMEEHASGVPIIHPAAWGMAIFSDDDCNNDSHH